ncbi:MAG: hypothetical protein AB7E80_12015 [Hyphomicrobiaceae bacterium]
MTIRPGHGTAACMLVMAASAALLSGAATAAVAADGQPLIKQRNMDVSRAGATDRPRSEGDQTLKDGWPLYRSDRGQQAFNDAMATLHATDGRAPAASAFKGCRELACPLALPKASADGWLPAGRIWVSPDEYVLIVHSHRNANGRYPRRSQSGMRIFVFHEFHNSTRNTDTYDTISSHRFSVFVPFYLSKQGTDVHGYKFVTVVQVAPYDVVGRHASNMGSAGPGIEVAKNYSEELEPLQGLAGVLVATIVKEAQPQLRVVNHRGREGRPMLDLYNEWLAALEKKAGASAVALPYVPAVPERVATASANFNELVRRPGLSPPIPVAERAFMPRTVKVARIVPKPASAAPAAAAAPKTRVVATLPLPTPRGPVVDDTILGSMRATRTRWIETGPEEAADAGQPQLVGPVRLAVRPAALRDAAPAMAAPRPVFLRAGSGG